MAWWGKVVGGMFGLMLGGPIGALLGAAFGHQLDERRAHSRERIGFHPGDQERTQAAFFTATFSVIGHISKADGRVSREEIALSQSIMNHMRLTGEQRKAAIALFNEGKNQSFDLDEVLLQLRHECHRRSTLMQMFLEIQVQAAFADGKLDPSENQVLVHIADLLGFSPQHLQEIIERARGAGSAHAESGGMELEDAYRVLGVTERTPLSEIKRTYRRLLSQHHPDKLVSKGLPEEMIKLANEKTHEIRTAWQKVQEVRQ